jgi:hypothetical protein
LTKQPGYGRITSIFKCSEKEKAVSHAPFRDMPDGARHNRGNSILAFSIRAEKR